ncbi:MAG: hypothetical protein CMJ18_19705 [Phycisphaeraceae bacterium]|nr:hypothetical protein [Phycisphaeraceae bacterium]
MNARIATLTMALAFCLGGSVAFAAFEVVGSEDFEGRTGIGNISDFHNPSTTIGDWDEPLFQGQGDIVENSDGVGPNAFAGTGKGHIFREATGCCPNISASMAFTRPVTAGEILELSWQTWYDGSVNNGLEFNFREVIGDYIAFTATLLSQLTRDDLPGWPDDNIRVGPENVAGSGFDTGLVPNYGNWEEYKLTYVVGSDSMTVSVGGNSVVADLTQSNFPGIQQIVGYTWKVSDSPGILYIDNVLAQVIPEPATLGLMTLGGLLALRRRR